MKRIKKAEEEGLCAPFLCSNHGDKRYSSTEGNTQSDNIRLLEEVEHLDENMHRLGVDYSNMSLQEAEDAYKRASEEYMRQAQPKSEDEEYEKAMADYYANGEDITAQKPTDEWDDIPFQFAGENNLILRRSDGEDVQVQYYPQKNKDVKPFNIKVRKLGKTVTKDTNKKDIQTAILGNKEKIYAHNIATGINASVTKKNINEMISAIFKNSPKGVDDYKSIKKEIVANVEDIFEAAQPILLHNELKNSELFDKQIIHRFALPVRIGTLDFFVMITVKERLDADEARIDEFSIYSLQSENKKAADSPSMPEKNTAQSHYQLHTYNINDLIDFVNKNLEKYKTSLSETFYQSAYEPETYYQSAFAGSRVDYDRPSLEAIGSGEGHAAHGWGLYYALNKDVAEDYRKKFIYEAPADMAIQDHKRLVLIAERGKQFFIDKLNELIGIREELNKAYEKSNEIYDKIRDIEKEERLADDAFLFDKETDARKKQKAENKKKLSELRKQRDEADNNIDEINLKYSNAAAEDEDVIDFMYTIDNRFNIDTLRETIKEVQDTDISKVSKGQVHEVDIPENPYLMDEDLMYNEQPKIVQQALDNIINDLSDEQISMEFSRTLYPENRDALRRMWKDGDYEFLNDGRSIYQSLVIMLGSKKAASQMLEKHGVKGITYYGQQDGRCFVIFNPDDVKVIQKFYQNAERGKGVAKGAYTGSDNVIHLFETADASTFMHETAHWFRRELRRSGTKRSIAMLKKVDAWENAEFAKRYKVELKDGYYVVTDTKGNEVYANKFGTETWYKLVKKRICSFS